MAGRMRAICIQTACVLDMDHSGPHQLERRREFLQPALFVVHPEPLNDVALPVGNLALVAPALAPVVAEIAQVAHVVWNGPVESATLAWWTAMDQVVSIATGEDVMDEQRQAVEQIDRNVHSEPPIPLYPPRHLGRLPLTREAMHRLLGVPDDLRIVDCYWDERLDTLMVTVEGEQLNPVPEGCEPRTLTGRWSFVSLPEEEDETQAEFGRLEWVGDCG